MKIAQLRRSYVHKDRAYTSNRALSFQKETGNKIIVEPSLCKIVGGIEILTALSFLNYLAFTTLYK
jgi:hypothetical protein